MWNIKRILRHTIRTESGKCALLYYMSVWLNGRKTKTKTKQTTWTRTITHICCVLKFECAAIAVQIKKLFLPRLYIVIPHLSDHCLNCFTFNVKFPINRSTTNICSGMSSVSLSVRNKKGIFRIHIFPTFGLFIYHTKRIIKKKGKTHTQKCCRQKNGKESIWFCKKRERESDREGDKLTDWLTEKDGSRNSTIDNLTIQN